MSAKRYSVSPTGDEKKPEQAVAEDWGDAWGNDKRRPMPSAMTSWISDCRARVRNALCGREVQRKMILAGLGVRNKGGPISPEQEEEIMRRLGRGDELREHAASWAVGSTNLEGVVCRPRRLAYLATLGLVPKPPEEAVAFLGIGQRAPVDHDFRMRQAAEMVANGETWA